MSLAGWFLAFFLLGAPPQALEPLPRPDLEAFEEDVREVLRRTRAELDRRRGEVPETVEATRALAQAFGEAGRLYHAFGLESLAAACYRNGTLLDPSEPRWIYLEAVLHQENRRLEAAAAGFRRVAESAPDYWPARLRLAETLRLAGEKDAAEKIFRQVSARPEADPGARAYARLGLGRTADDPEEAVDRLLAVLEAFPEAGAAAQQLAVAYRRLGRSAEAREAFARAGPGEPSFHDPWAERAASTGGATAQMLLGNARLRLGDPQGALGHHRKARQGAPEDPAAARALALTLEELGEMEEALGLYDAARRLAPGEGIYLYDWARAAWAAGVDRREVLEALRELSLSAPDFLNGHLLRAAVHMELQDPKAAEQSLHRALALSPGEPRALRSLAGLRLQRAEGLLAAGDSSGALQALGEAVEFAPEESQIRVDLAHLLWAEERGEEALEHLEKILARDPDDLPALDLLARVLATGKDEGLRDGPRAVAAARRVFAAEPTPWAAETVALALAAAGAFQEAVEWQGRLLAQMIRLRAPESDLDRLKHNLERFRDGKIGEVRIPGPREGR